MIRELTRDEKWTLWQYMMTLGEFSGLLDDLTGDHAEDFDYVTSECTLKHVIAGGGKFITVGLFWNGGNHIVNIFQGSREDVAGSYKWEITANTSCNNADDYVNYQINERLGERVLAEIKELKAEKLLSLD